MTHYAAYLRASPGNRQDLSVERQRLMVQNWASENGHTIGRIFLDDARSGSSTVGRDGFLGMVQYLAGGTPESGLVLWEYTRLARSYDDAQFYLASIRRNGYEVLTLSEQIPPGAIGRLMESIHLWAAEDERTRMVERVRSGLAHLVHHHHCWPTGGQPPAGYRHEEIVIGTRRDGSVHIGRRLVPDPIQAPLVVKAFEMRAGGHSMAEIHAATRLVQRKTSYAALLTNRLYLGEFTYGGRTSTDYCAPLVTPDLFARVQVIEQAWSEKILRYHARRATSAYALSGLLLCGHCDTLMSGKPNQRQRYYICGNRYDTNVHVERCPAPGIPVERIDQMVISRLLEIIESGHVIELAQRYNQSLQSGDQALQSRLASARADLELNRRSQARIVAAITDGGHSRALVAELQRLEDAEPALIQALTTLENSRPAPVSIPDLDQLSAALRQALEHTSDPRKVQLLLRQLVVFVRASKSPLRFGEISGTLRWSIGVVGESAL